jgi:hypothetical protein
MAQYVSHHAGGRLRTGRALGASSRRPTRASDRPGDSLRLLPGFSVAPDRFIMFYGGYCPDRGRWPERETQSDRLTLCERLRFYQRKRVSERPMWRSGRPITGTDHSHFNVTLPSQSYQRRPISGRRTQKTWTLNGLTTQTVVSIFSARIFEPRFMKGPVSGGLGGRLLVSLDWTGAAGLRQGHPS